VAREDFEALLAGKDHVAAGAAKNKAQAAAGQIMSEPAEARTQGAQAEPHGSEESRWGRSSAAGLRASHGNREIARYRTARGGRR
jgi:hypothetical protein